MENQDDESSKESLVLLARKKEKEAKTLTAKHKKHENKFARLLRLQKVYVEDFATFQKFACSLIPSAQILFDEAGNERPIDSSKLMEHLEMWRQELRQDSERRQNFDMLVRLVFGETVPTTAEAQPPSEISHVRVNDMAATGRSMWQKLTSTQTEQVQAPPSILDRWQLYEKEQSSNRNSVTQAVDDAVEAINARIAACRAEIANSEERAEKMRAQLCTSSASNVFQMSPRGPVHPRIEELREARDVALKHYNKLKLNRSSGDSSSHSDLEVKRLRVMEELVALKEKLQAEKDESAKELSVCEANGMIEESEILSMEAELNNCSFLEDAAACQAQIDMQLESYNGLEELTDDIKELQGLISASSNQCAMLEEAIAQKCAGEEAVRNLPYLREVVVKFVEYTQRGDMTAATLLPVICTILGATEEERARLEQRFPSTWLYLHQTMGQFN